MYIIHSSCNTSLVGFVILRIIGLPIAAIRNLLIKKSRN